MLAHEKLEKNLLEYDALTHTPITAAYKELSRRFPESRFILTVREKEPWLQSCEKYFGSRRSDAIPPTALKMRRVLYGADDFNLELFSQAFHRYPDEVKEHFGEGAQDRLLVLDICGGEGFERLCPFLGMPSPDVPFPHSPAGGGDDSPLLPLLRAWARRAGLGGVRRFLTGRSR